MNNVIHHTANFTNSINEYLLYHEYRPLHQNRLNLNSLVALLKRIASSLPEMAEEFKLIDHEISEVDKILYQFEDLPPVNELESHQKDIQRAQVNRLTGRILIKTETINNTIENIHTVIEQQYGNILKTNNYLLFVLLVALVLTGIATTTWIYFSIVPQLSLLQKATKALSAGDFEHEVAISSKDELGQLSKSFNAMTRQLKEMTVSRNVLLEEIAVRKKAEADLRDYKDNLETLIVERTKELQKRKKEWEDTFDAMSDVITIQDKDMRIVRANKAAYKTFEVEPGGLIGKHCYEVIRGSSHPCPSCPALSTLTESKTASENITHKDLGKIFQVTSSPIIDENGNFTHIVHIAKDITENKKMEEELFQAHKMEAIGTLAGGIAHDFNNILALIIGYADMAQDDIPPSSPAHNSVNQVLNAGNRAKDLVKQILTFSRKSQETQQPMQPSSIIKEGLKLMRASLPTTIEIQQSIDQNCGHIIADPTNIHQILVNLCTNAFHAMKGQPGVLTVKLRQVNLKKAEVGLEAGIAPGTFIELLVSDTGCGMDEATVERIFEPYFTTKEVGKGTGMGLALVHGIVQRSGGFIQVESAPGQGSTFHIYFPAVFEQVTKKSDKAEAHLPRGNENVLVVDDEELIVGMYQTTLEKLGYKVAAYCSSTEALDAFQLNPDSFDLIITDQTMPHLTGSTLAGHILKQRPDIPIILCTGYDALITEEKAAKIGIKRFLYKPISRKTLAIAVREILDQKISHKG